MKSSPRVISSPKDLAISQNDLQSGDIINCRIPLRPGEDSLLLDLVERGIHLIPSATSQLASRSKVFQTHLFRNWMIPGTLAIFDRQQLLEATSTFQKAGASKIIFKEDRKNAGIGIALFPSIEDVYNQSISNSLSYPFVLQPFHEGSTDLRIIVLGDYVEGYIRKNPHGFRNNLHCGGNSKPFKVSKELLQLCKDIMNRGSFPYAHLDFMLLENDQIYLSEINLRGGIKGALISHTDYRERVAQIIQSHTEQLIQK